MKEQIEELKAKLATYEAQQHEEKEGLTAAIVAEISKVTGDLNDLYQRTQTAVVNLDNKVANFGNRLAGMERYYAVGDRTNDKKTLLNKKDMKPKVFEKEDDWRRWRSDVEDYCEEVFPGMKALLEKAKDADRAVDEEWFGEDTGGWWMKGDMLHRYLKQYTGSESRRIVLGVSDDNSWEAWR